MFDFLRDQFQSNPVFSGMVSAGLLGAVAFQLRALPGYLWKLFAMQFLLVLKVHHDERSYRQLSYWLGKHTDGKKARRVQLNHIWDTANEKEHVMVTPGAGWHRVREDGRTYWVHRDVKEPGPDAGMMAHRTETLTLYTFGRDPEVFKGLVDKITSIFEDKDSIPIYTAASNGGYVLAGRRTKRDLSTIDIPQEIKTMILRRIDEFMASRERYAAMAIPWRLGILLEGIPGSGKSSLIAAIASYLERPIYLMNPAVFDKDSNVQDALTGAGSGVVTIEDADSIPALLKRRADDAGHLEVEGQSEAGKGLTLSGFLNAIDGVASHEGRILILTSNHADALDPALLRPGRINLRINLGEIAAPEIVSMFARLNPGRTITEAQAQPWVGLSPAAVQDRLLEGRTPMDDQPAVSLVA